MVSNVGDVSHSVEISISRLLCVSMHIIPSDVPSVPLDTNVVPGHLIFHAVSDVWMAI